MRPNPRQETVSVAARVRVLTHDGSARIDPVREGAGTRVERRFAGNIDCDRRRSVAELQKSMSLTRFVKVGSHELLSGIDPLGGRESGLREINGTELNRWAEAAVTSQESHRAKD